jgi:hypothetical protein
MNLVVEWMPVDGHLVREFQTAILALSGLFDYMAAQSVLAPKASNRAIGLWPKRAIGEIYSAPLSLNFPERVRDRRVEHETNRP